MRVARVIPCLDVTNGRVVKGVNFVGLRDAGDPVELAAKYDLDGADELVFLDITASSDGRDTMVDVVYRTAEQVFIPFTVGGGIRTVDDARAMLRAGADKVSVNTAAVHRPALISDIAAEFEAQQKATREATIATLPESQREYAASLPADKLPGFVAAITGAKPTPPKPGEPGVARSGKLSAEEIKANIAKPGWLAENFSRM